MRKVFALLISMLLLFTVYGCETVETKVENDRLKIVTTIFPPYDFAKNIAGENADIVQLLYAGAESHTYEPTPRDIIKIGEADLFIYVGGKSDTWIKDSLLSGELKGVNALSMIDVVTLYKEEHEESEHHEEGLKEEHEYDEHVWTSPKNAVLICQAISDALCKIDEKNAQTYRDNAYEYINKLENLDRDLAEITSNAKRKTLIFGDRFPFLYLAREYGLEYYSAFPGCAAEAEPSASTVSFLINKVLEEEIPVVFYIEFSTQKVADIICEGTNAKKLLLHSCHNVTKKEKEEGVSYIKLMEQNIKNLTEALS